MILIKTADNEIRVEDANQWFAQNGYLLSKVVDQLLYEDGTNTVITEWVESDGNKAECRRSFRDLI